MAHPNGDRPVSLLRARCPRPGVRRTLTNLSTSASGVGSWLLSIRSFGARGQGNGPGPGEGGRATLGSSRQSPEPVSLDIKRFFSSDTAQGAASVGRELLSIVVLIGVDGERELSQLRSSLHIPQP